MEKFKFKLGEKIVLKNKTDKIFVIIGRAEYHGPYLYYYLLQNESSFNLNGLNFTKGQWETENKLLKIKEQ
jgi:hypothetical protein